MLTGYMRMILKGSTLKVQTFNLFNLQPLQPATFSTCDLRPATRNLQPLPMLTAGAVERFFFYVVTRLAHVRLQIFGALLEAGHCVHSAVKPAVPGKHQRAAQRELATRTRGHSSRVPCCLMGYDFAL